MLGSNIKIGLQIKAVVILAFVVFSALLGGGWAYHRAVSVWMQRELTEDADQLANALCVAAAEPLSRRDRVALHRLSRDFVEYEDILYVSFVDTRGVELADSWRDSRGRRAQPGAPQPAEMAYSRVVDNDCLVVACPIQASGRTGQIVGGVRLTLDTSAAAEQIHDAHAEMLVWAGIILTCTVPLGYLLVFRMLVLPVRRLVRATGRLADGDYAARAAAPRNDELGALADSFNAMAEKIDRQRRQLLGANVELESKVAERTDALHRVNKRLRTEMDEREQFLRAVSHDLNAPLRNIAGMAAMITMKWRGDLPEDAVARLERIRANVDTQTEMIGELLELSRIRSKPQTREPVDMGILLDDIRSTFEFDLRQKNIQLLIGPRMPVLHVERNRMRQVFQNLIDNAVKYMHDRENGRIGITYECCRDEHLFHVADNGPGIAQADRERIFVVFRRAAAAASGADGKGVGLASVRTIAGNYEGRVWVDSTPGVGSTFHVTLARSCTELPADTDSDQAREQPDSCLVSC